MSKIRIKNYFSETVYASFAKCIILSFYFQIESELVWFNFRGNGTSFLAGKTKTKTDQK